MDWNAAREDERQVLKRIIALLFAFAGLAERLSDLPHPARECVLWALRSAEMVAREFVVETAVDQGAQEALIFLLMPALHAGNNPDDSTRLATSFKALAVLLDRLANGDNGRRAIDISKVCIKLAACAAVVPPLSGKRYEQRQLSLAPPGFAVGRCDSS